MSRDSERLEQDRSAGATVEFSVSELVTTAAACLEDLWEDGVWVVGEVASLKTYDRSGHTYMTLKDGSAEVRCVLYQFESKLVGHFPEIGEEISVLALPRIYRRKGSFQLNIKDIRAKGRGQLYKQFLELKEELRRKGWFDPTAKKPLAPFPSALAVVVSLEGAAWHDVRTTLARRLPSLPVTVVPAPAQGATAATKIATAIARADKLGCDALLLCRGGGSIEDLQAYNAIEVATAVHRATTPVITGVGHESDETIVDHVADRRASTPTAAAVEATPDRTELLYRCAELEQRGATAVRRLVASSHERIDAAAIDLGRTVKASVLELGTEIAQLGYRLHHQTAVQVGRRRDALHGSLGRMQGLMARLAGARPALDGLTRRLRAAARRSVAIKLGSLEGWASRIESLSPQRTLERGYALVTDSIGTVVTGARQLSVAQEATVGFRDGAVGVKVTAPSRQSPLPPPAGASEQ